MNNELFNILEQVTDPEIPALSIREMGILRGAESTGNKAVITITPTYSGCPAIGQIQNDIKKALAENGFNNVEIITRLSPAWTTDWMSEKAKNKLKESGIAPPGGNANKPMEFMGILNLASDKDMVHCPRCNSSHTVLKSSFGATACKALYVCNNCREPFEYFKPH